MRVIRGIGFFSLLLVATLFVQNASATLELVLPGSSYYGGSVYYNEEVYDEAMDETGWLRGRIDFAVYDTETYANEFIGTDGFDMPGTGRYIYAYQIFNDYDGSDEAVAHFAILDINGVAVEEALVNGTSAQRDSPDEPSEEGIAPTPIESETQGVWKWTFDGEGYVYKGEHSWFLVFSSDSVPVSGGYEIKGPISDDFMVPDVPEPTTIALLGLGSAVLFKRRRKSV